MKEKTKKTKD